MESINNYYLFLISAIMLNMTPGTDTIFIVSKSISQGKKAGIFSALGVMTGVVLHTILIKKKGQALINSRHL
ncbi:MAG: amino acid transporter LysE [Clostridia bacterium]|jgi:threonine/homoserine/homoserine lactone efflux protein|nr:amino acid transporter LysE [Clostridia bacterium]